MEANQPSPTTGSPITRALLAFALGGFVLLLLRLGAEVVVPVMLAFFIAALAMPLQRALLRRGMKPVLALVLLIALLLVGGGLIFVLAVTGVSRLQAGLSLYSEQLAARFAELEQWLAGLGLTVEGLGPQIAAALTSLLARVLAGIVAAAGTTLVSMVMAAFFLIELPRFLRILKSKAVQERPVLSRIPQVARTAVQYFGIRTRLNLFTGAGVTAICLLLGIDYPLLWGLLAFVLSYIPYIGLVMAMIPPALLALAELGWIQAAVVVVVILVINVTIENIVEPGYTGQRLRLSATVVFLSFFFWAWLLGPVGALLSMPITVLIMLVFAEEDGTRWMSQIIGREG